MFQVAFVYKKKLSIFEYSPTRSWELKRELSLPGVVISGAWPARQLCLGFKREYLLMEEESGDFHDLFSNNDG